MVNVSEEKAATMANKDHYDNEFDVLLVGAGIMSATLGAMLQALEPSWSQIIYERLDGPAEESSYPFNNCLLYTSPSPRDS